MMNFAGIDFGSKLAGTTAICHDDGGIKFLQSEKGRDADWFLESFVREWQPEKIFIDAPLSLPKAYFSNDHRDFFYRKCDRETKAMSPMFLGGLTARAIRLKHDLEKTGVLFFESYPRGLVDELSKKDPALLEFYKTDIRKFTDRLILLCKPDLKMAPVTWHQADALLAFLIGDRFHRSLCKTYGDETEGLIYV
jgi:uncharacterized protein